MLVWQRGMPGQFEGVIPHALLLPTGPCGRAGLAAQEQSMQVVHLALRQDGGGGIVGGKEDWGEAGPGHGRGEGAEARASPLGIKGIKARATAHLLQGC